MFQSFSVCIGPFSVALQVGLALPSWSGGWPFLLGVWVGLPSLGWGLAFPFRCGEVGVGPAFLVCGLAFLFREEWGGWPLLVVGVTLLCSGGSDPNPEKEINRVLCERTCVLVEHSEDAIRIE